jgi:hypothetical protein
MPKDLLPAERRKVENAYRRYVEKINSAWEAMATHGLDSKQFALADKRADEARKKLRAVSGHKKGHWRG